MASSFEVVIVHGSFHTPEPYEPFIAALKKEGITAHCPQLPSSNPTNLNLGDNLSNPDYEREPPPGGYPQPVDDAKIVQPLLRKLIVEEKKKVIVLGHSSGGFTATFSAIPELQARTREANGEEGGVIGIFYMCAFVIPVGESMYSSLQPKDGSAMTIPEWCNLHKNGLVTARYASKTFFNLLSPSKEAPDKDADYYESIMTATSIFTTVLENDTYSQLPCLYLMTKNDKAIQPAAQEGMVALQNSRDGVDIKVVRCEADHSPQLGWTDGVVKEVKEFGEGILTA